MVVSSQRSRPAKAADGGPREPRSPASASAGVACGIARMVHAPPSLPLPGLVIESGSFSLEPSWWTCCAAQGQRFNAATNTVTHCELTRRTRIAAQLANTWLSRFEGDTAKLSQAVSSIDPVLMARHGVRLMQTVLYRAHRGLAEPMASDQTIAQSPLWVVAMAAAWRYGLTPHVVDISARGFGSDAALLPKLPPPGSDTQAPRTVIFALGVTGLSEPAAAERFELLVDIAYRSRLPLWCEMSVPVAAMAGSPSSSPGRVTREAYAARIERLRREPPWRQLTAGSRARLAAVCDLAALQAQMRTAKS